MCDGGCAATGSRGAPLQAKPHGRFHLVWGASENGDPPGNIVWGVIENGDSPRPPPRQVKYNYSVCLGLFRPAQAPAKATARVNVRGLGPHPSPP